MSSQLSQVRWKEGLSVLNVHDLQEGAKNFYRRLNLSMPAYAIHTEACKAHVNAIKETDRAIKEMMK